MICRLRKSRVEKEEPTINLTPLMDVVFCILIMFIAVAPLLELDQVELADGKKGSVEKAISVQESGPVVIHVHADNTISFNQQRVDLASLSVLLREAKLKYPEARLSLFHDRQAHFGTYQSIKNLAEMAGFEQLDIVLKPA